jgi:nucleoside phosphorylase
VGAREVPQRAPEARLIGVVVALGAEARTLRPLESAWGVHVALAGVGAAGARAAAERLANAGAAALITWGVAGSLVPGLDGCLVLPAEVHTLDGVCYELDPGWHTAIAARLRSTRRDPVVEGPLVTSTHPIGSASSRKALASRTGAVAVDMEAAAVAEVARRRGLPCLALRAIADTLEMPWPAALGAVGQGKLWQGRLLVSALTGVADWPRWPGVASAYRAACRRLQRAAEDLAAAGPARLTAAES